MIVRTIEQSVRIPGNGMQAPDPYGPFLDWVRQRSKEISILTFNYDLCSDWALHLAGLRPDYRLPNDGPEDRGAIDVLKLHGTLNWAWCDHCQIVPKRPSDLTMQDPSTHDGRDCPANGRRFRRPPDL
jgi:NAD-dependent SIR2 family protein deacetylase